MGLSNSFSNLFYIENETCFILLDKLRATKIGIAFYLLKICFCFVSIGRSFALLLGSLPASCRTAALGGHVEVCDGCHASKVSYNSCRNRNCPKCGNLKKEQWVLDRSTELLPVPYFHTVFTVPHELNGLFLANQKLMYSLLFKAASKTLYCSWWRSFSFWCFFCVF